MASWHRFDLVESSYAMGLMAHTTPAWRERYLAILDQLIERHTGWWSASDWLTQFGHDPDQADDNVKQGKRRCRHSQNHDAPPDVATIALRC